MNTETFTIKQINATETFAVRHPVLRKGRPLETCAMPGDTDDDTFHLGLFDAQKLIGVVTFMNVAKPQFTGKQYQLRGMAVLDDYQGQSLGNLLVDEGEKLLKAKTVNTLWCNARVKALNFYLRKGFAISGEPFEIEPVGTHYLLFKTL
ncbi:GNAT family N-acetyltransferase [Leeuwenhoekiella marinoflava]|uniref:Acetyltransferase (GNAT) family protein n=2 Tax=Leeuwenhoekiella marinoflava TaxID=988 RepID=A0A4Q0PID7_9FLAO|nr:GNAT family N-acetyltransferase [Leeuwenhoekiella marinoflava]RXG26841.1 acetyltransferase (GNAT) family protein [Leeuwenhoekiella marinoflava]SHF39119.1 Acetyltransferase (GNAT) family protein [Leeuwenhoekiella marinoflava DSM 3653]